MALSDQFQKARKLSTVTPASNPQALQMAADFWHFYGFSLGTVHRLCKIPWGRPLHLTKETVGKKINFQNRSGKKRKEK